MANEQESIMGGQLNIEQSNVRYNYIYYIYMYGFSYHKKKIIKRVIYNYIYIYIYMYGFSYHKKKNQACWVCTQFILVLQEQVSFMLGLSSKLCKSSLKMLLYQVIKSCWELLLKNLYKM